jgi:GNAT superfamily N-acetyltransferase
MIERVTVAPVTVSRMRSRLTSQRSSSPRGDDSTSRYSVVTSRHSKRPLIAFSPRYPITRAGRCRAEDSEIIYHRAMSEIEKTGRGAAGPPVLIRPLSAADREAALAVINEAARWYREFLPPAEYHEPEMTADDWDREALRLTWFGALVGGTLVGVGGLERVRDVALLRHGYVLPAWQRAGIGARLVEHLEREARGVDRVIVGTYQGNYKARRALEKAGYRRSPDPEVVLRAFYSIPEARLRSSVTYEKTLAPT